MGRRDVSSAQTLRGALERGASSHGDSPWLAYQRPDAEVESWTWQQALDSAARTASMLAEHGIGPGDRVNVHLSNCPEFYDLWFAASLSGAVIVPTNPSLTADELAFQLQHAGCRITVTQPDLVETLQEASAACPAIEAGLVTGDQWSEAVASHSAEPPRHTADPEDVLSVLYTSGTTSRPKGVMVSQAAYCYAGEVVAQHIRLRPEDRQLVVLPLFHGNAQYYSTMSALVTGASVALAPRFTASGWSRQATNMKATVASLFAAPIRMILAADPSDHDRAHALRLALFAQSVTPQELSIFEERFGCPLLQLYGMTETVAPPTINPPYGERRNMSMGQPTISATVRVEDGQLLVQGTPGQTMMTGYLDDEAATATAIRDGYLHTGDSVRVDADGYLHFVDRRKDLIKRAGENISSVEVEQVLGQHVAVFEAAVIGLPDPVYDEAVAAFVVPVKGSEPSAEELAEWCAERLAAFKVPATIEFVPDLPRTPVGKVQKHLIAKVAIESEQEENDGVQAGSR